MGGFQCLPYCHKCHHWFSVETIFGAFILITHRQHHLQHHHLEAGFILWLSFKKDSGSPSKAEKKIGWFCVVKLNSKDWWMIQTLYGCKYNQLDEWSIMLPCSNIFCFCFFLDVNELLKMNRINAKQMNYQRRSVK